jgi:TetR/AcrR family transcriptional repressor of nem operon
MAKSSKSQAAENRHTVVDAASRLFRAQGFRATSVPEIMRAADLTHGGFYGHFASKEALAAEALDAAFASLAAARAQTALTPEGEAIHPAWVDSYLTAEHRDAPGPGCPVAALAGDVAREATDSPVRESFARGVEQVVAQLVAQNPEHDPEAALADYATLIGSLLLARATAGRPLSDAFLAAGQARIKRQS